RRDVRMREGHERVRVFDERGAGGAVGKEPLREQAYDNGAPEARVASAEQLAGAGRFQPLEQVVVCDDAYRRGRRCAHFSSITVCTSSLASPICSSTIARSIAGRPGRRLLWQYTPCWPTIARASVRRSS